MSTVEDIIRTGACDGRCLVAQEGGPCECACRGKFHGALLDVNVDRVNVDSIDGDPLAGRYFHTQKEQPDCRCLVIEWQGQVLGKVADGTYLVDTLSWLDGTSYQQLIVTVDELMARNAVFYEDSAAMRYAREFHRGVRSGCPHESSLRESSK